MALALVVYDMQIFLGVSLHHAWAVEGTRLGMCAQESHTSRTIATKNVQDAHALLSNSF